MIKKGFLNGGNGIAMAMGITGCGKTYTLIVSVKINRILNLHVCFIKR
jgi:hypothetical protein